MTLISHLALELLGIRSLDSSEYALEFRSLIEPEAVDRMAILRDFSLATPGTDCVRGDTEQCRSFLHPEVFGWFWHFNVSGVWGSNQVTKPYQLFQRITTLLLRNRRPAGEQTGDWPRIMMGSLDIVQVR